MSKIVDSFMQNARTIGIVYVVGADMTDRNTEEFDKEENK